jgi:hypothetical protein
LALFWNLNEILQIEVFIGMIHFLSMISDSFFSEVYPKLLRSIKQQQLDLIRYFRGIFLHEENLRANLFYPLYQTVKNLEDAALSTIFHQISLIHYSLEKY